jgi:hypothetical protein
MYAPDPKQLKKYLRFAFDLSLFYYFLFTIVCYASYFQIPKINSFLFDALKGGFVLFWFYLLLIILRITNIIQLKQVRFLLLLLLTLLIMVFYSLSGIE